MSRIGRAPVELPGGVNVELSDRSIKVTGPRGELTVPVGRGVRVEQEDGSLVVRRNSDAPPDRAMHGLTRSLLQNAVTGVTDGFTRTLNIAGVGYRAALQGRDINLQVGYSHPVGIVPREGIEFEVPNATTIIVRGNDKQQVGQMAAEIRKVRPPEPYKGKGIRYSDEQVRRKVGKAG
jgi:large subunit ribosomal protein L6